MNKPTRITLALGLAGCAAFLASVLRTGAPSSADPAQKRPPAVLPSPMQHPLAGKSKALPPPADDAPLLPPANLTGEPPGAPVVAAPVAFSIPGSMLRPAEESMMSTWAARDPEGAGRWLDQNRDHPKFADMVRGYAIQIATIDPSAARQWAAVLKGNGNRFNKGGTLEQHIDAIEEMLKGPAPVGTATAGTSAGTFKPAALFMPDYTPVLVRQHPEEEPVIVMNPINPFG